MRLGALRGLGPNEKKPKAVFEPPDYGPLAPRDAHWAILARTTMALIASRLDGYFLVRTWSFGMDIGAVISRQQVGEVAGVCGLVCPDLESA